VDNLDAIAFVQESLLPLVASHDIPVQLDRHPLWRQREFPHQTLQG
jgi:hypothetical protein